MLPIPTAGIMTGSKPDIDNNRYCIIHGHFYQPSREDPWLNIIGEHFFYPL